MNPEIKIDKENRVVTWGKSQITCCSGQCPFEAFSNKDNDFYCLYTSEVTGNGAAKHLDELCFFTQTKPEIPLELIENGKIKIRWGELVIGDHCGGCLFDGEVDGGVFGCLYTYIAFGMFHENFLGKNCYFTLNALSCETSDS